MKWQQKLFLLKKRKNQQKKKKGKPKWGSFMSKKKGRTILKIENKHIIVSAIVVLLAMMFIFSLPYLSETMLFSQTEENTSSEKEPEDLFRHPLTGVWGYEEVIELPHVYGVMIENHIDARPQAGLDQAFLVIEAPVEAGISRMIAFYSEDQEVEKIGPVRSARSYYVDWAHELDAMYTHVGGSPEALDQIATDGTFDLNQYWNDDFFWRSSNRNAPHNVYTSTDLLSEALAYYEGRDRVPNILYGLWHFKDSQVIIPEKIVGVSIDFSIYDWNLVSWEFDSSLMRYSRFQKGIPHTMESEDQIFADNIAIIVTDVEILDEIGRRSVRTIGKGNAFVFQDGLMQEAIWEKPSLSERLMFYTKEGEEIEMNAGITWIEVVPNEEILTFE
ncbi:TPA: hypothetical protein DDZ01_01285 [Candidatus Uhrbacteria bacterium]|nr:hypothetical protein [Candidatus Uhrbacteria bacterium]